MRRTHGCGELRPAHDGSRAVVMGWVNRRRDLGSLIFIDLRDRSGILQVVFKRETSPEAHARAEELRSEYVVAVEGKLVQRDSNTVNPALPTGEVELIAERLYILNDARTPPFPVEDDNATAEDTRLSYRFIDLRRPRMQANLILRHRLCLEIRRFLNEQGFLEIETPVLTRSTPEGARDYLVPSRVQPGYFYALPQSPQLFKQILMIAGLDKYFQIVRCFRDEDLRADRQPEFTQVDMEMSFTQPEMIFGLIEPLIENICKVAEDHWQQEWPRRLQNLSPEERKKRVKARKPIKCTLPFPRLTYDEVMSQYGTDKPDLRYEAKIVSLDSLVSAKLAHDFGIMPPIIGFKFSSEPKYGPQSRTAIKTRIQSVIDRGQNSLPELKSRQDEIGRPALFVDWCLVEEGAQILRDTQLARTLQITLDAKQGDVLFLGAIRGTAELRDPYLPHRCFDILRNELAQFSLGYSPQRKRFLWITQFPMFEYDEQEQRFVAMHHPFTSPTEETLELLETNPAAVKAKAYDLVLNGVEIGGGSIRIHRQDIQRRVFRALGFSEEQARARFGFFLDALEYGTPPHGGIALGLDRIVAILAMEASIREVIAFPKTARAVDLMCEAPAPVSPAQLQELGLELKKDLT
ncbi:MAG: aspartate--tRNA ligase [Acidobacteria bacterium]|nr:aspartate--tRNA ligase [Acidobacteriota bacterium]